MICNLKHLNTFSMVHEEIAKLSLFSLFLHLSKSNKNPIGIMFYGGMVGLGFAIVENFDYYILYGYGILPLRNVTSTIAHMIFGMFAGYWIALSKVKITKYGNRSVFDILMAKYQTLRTIVHYGIGLLCGIAYHGLWNYNLYSSGESAISVMILMMLIGLIGVKFAASTLQSKREDTEE
jgi:RsiW-degrading membrane proteinase PrsW (M82 family)